VFGSPPAELSRLPADEHDPERDDTLTLLLLCCHPALAVAMVRGPDAGLELLASLDGDARVARHHRLFAMRGHLLEMSGSPAAARAAFEEAARRTPAPPRSVTCCGGRALSY
jgi:predicted RNA polymerase sigma factor